MALVKLGGGVTGLSGSIGGSTFARNRSGNYCRPRTKPVNPKSNLQEATRTIMKLLAAVWSSSVVSSVQRGAWGTYAAAVAVKNRLGESIYLTGFNHFLRSNSARIAAGLLEIDTAPTDLTLPAGDPVFSVTADAGGQQLTVTFDDTAAWCSETGGCLLVAMGQPQNASRNFFGGPWRIAEAILGNTGSPITSPQVIDAPFTLVAGQQIWCQARVIRADARISNQFRAASIIVGGLALTYHVTGTLSPDITDGNFVYSGSLNGKAFFKKASGYYLWWDGDTKWILSEVLGDLGAGHWYLATAAIAGVYTAVSTNTGAATVVLGPL